MTRNLFLTLLLAVGLQNYTASAETVDGEALYLKHCQSCHGGTVAKAPPVTLLGIMSTRSILRAMETGVMTQQARHLEPDERQAVAEYLTGHPVEPYVSPAPACASASQAPEKHATGGWVWGMNRANHRFIDKDQAGLEASDLPGMELAWAFAFPDALRARSQPAVVGDVLFVGSQDGTVYALDRHSGCIHWTFSTIAEVRTGIVVGTGADGRSRVFFGDLVGNVIWRDRPDDHPSLTLTAAPALYDGVLYVPMSALEVTEAADPGYACCTFRGGVAAYSAASGKRLWTGYTIDQPPREVGRNSAGTPRIAPSGAPVWNTPTIDAKRGVLYVGTGENYSSPANDTSDAIIAMSLADGHIVWSRQMTAGDAWNMGCETEDKINCPPENGPDYDFGAATILATTATGRDLLIAGQKSGDVYALDPERRGEVVWKRDIGRGGIQGGVHFGMALDGDVVYVPMSDFDGGPRWPGKAYPGMYALALETGETLWFNRAENICGERDFCQPGLSAAATAIPGGVIAGAMDGHLRVYDRKTGNVIWDIDTAVPYDTLDGGTAHGGSFGGGAGPVLVDGWVYVSSGYGLYNHMAGNVLLAFRKPASDPGP